MDHYCNKVNDPNFKPIGNQYGGVQNVPPPSSIWLCILCFSEGKMDLISYSIVSLKHKKSASRPKNDVFKSIDFSCIIFCNRGIVILLDTNFFSHYGQPTNQEEFLYKN